MGERKTAIHIDLAAPTPAYRQIADAIRALLVGGELSPGERLPTVRQLAIDLAVHHNTVAEAYRILSEEGWLDLRRKRGAMVVERPDQNVSAKERGALRNRLRGLIAEMRTAGVPIETIRAEFHSIAESLATSPQKGK
jgi:GntR family transcriptional regulator